MRADRLGRRGHDLHPSAWVRGNYVYLGVTGGASTWTPSAANYTQLTLSFTASGSTAQIYTHGWYAQGTYFADDVSLQGAGGTGVPGTPGTPVAGSITNTSAALSWGAASGTVTGYRVHEGSTVVSTVTGTSATAVSLDDPYSSMHPTHPAEPGL